jgi:hypothetical protein
MGWLDRTGGIPYAAELESWRELNVRIVESG